MSAPKIEQARDEIREKAVKLARDIGQLLLPILENERYAQEILLCSLGAVVQISTDYVADPIVFRQDFIKALETCEIAATEYEKKHAFRD